MLVALADIALVVASAGWVTMMVLLLAAVTLVAGWRVVRRVSVGRRAVAVTDAGSRGRRRA
jgi:hypothetical protein